VGGVGEMVDQDKENWETGEIVLAMEDRRGSGREEVEKRESCRGSAWGCMP